MDAWEVALGIAVLTWAAVRALGWWCVKVTRWRQEQREWARHVRDSWPDDGGDGRRDGRRG